MIPRVWIQSTTPPNALRRFGMRRSASREPGAGRASAVQAVGGLEADEQLGRGDHRAGRVGCVSRATSPILHSFDRWRRERNSEALLDRPLTARSVIASLLLGMHPPRLAGARLVRWCGVFGIAEGTARVALSRMVDRGELHGRDGAYELAGPVRARQRVQDWSLDPAPVAWNGSWRMGAVRGSARDATDRAALRDAMRQLRYAEARPGLWVRPANLPRDSGPDAAWIVADTQCEWWDATPMQDARALACRAVRSRRSGPRARTCCTVCSRASGRLTAPTDADLAHAFEAGAAVLDAPPRRPVAPRSALPGVVAG